MPERATLVALRWPFQERHAQPARDMLCDVTVH
jgi:hypothetical protein